MSALVLFNFRWGNHAVVPYANFQKDKVAVTSNEILLDISLRRISDYHFTGNLYTWKDGFYIEMGPMSLLQQEKHGPNEPKL